MNERILHPDAPITPGQIPLLMLHGYGANEADLYMLAADLPGNLYPVALRAPLDTPFGGYAWFPLHVDNDGNIHARPEDVRLALNNLEKRVQTLLQQLNRDQAAILGFSQGGMMAYMLADRHPQKFPWVAALSTYLPNAYALQAHIKPRLFVSHGLYDDVIPVDKARESIDRLRGDGYDPHYKEYPTGHYLSEENIRDLARWFDAQLNKQ